jgi:UDP-N-acetylglucosamine 2-epimerase (non-hydrolysing)
MEEGAVMLTGLEVPSILDALSLLESQPRGEHRMLRVVSDYNVPNVSEKIVRIVQSYTPYVRRTVWHEF